MKVTVTSWQDLETGTVFFMLNPAARTWAEVTVNNGNWASWPTLIKAHSGTSGSEKGERVHQLSVARWSLLCRSFFMKLDLSLCLSPLISVNDLSFSPFLLHFLPYIPYLLLLLMFIGYFPSGHFLFVLLLFMSTLFTPVLIPTDHHFLVAFTPSFSVSLFSHSSVLYFLSFLFSWLKHIFVPSFFLLRFVSCHSLSLHSFLRHFSLDLLLSQLFKHSLAAWQVLSAFLMASRIVAPAKWSFPSLILLPPKRR